MSACVHLVFWGNHLKLFHSMLRGWKQEVHTALTWAVMLNLLSRMIPRFFGWSVGVGAGPSSDCHWVESHGEVVSSSLCWSCCPALHPRNHICWRNGLADQACHLDHLLSPEDLGCRLRPTVRYWRAHLTVWQQLHLRWTGVLRSKDCALNAQRNIQCLLVLNKRCLIHVVSLAAI